MPLEILVVDNNSTDDTRAVVGELARRHHPRLRYIAEAAPGSSAARNAGTAASRGDIVVFVDDDVVAVSGWLRALAEVFEMHPEAWCVGGKVELKLPDEVPPWFDPARPGIIATYLSRQDYGAGTFRIDPSMALISANLAVTRDALRRLGGFDTTLGRFGRQLLSGEDLDLVQRIHRAGGPVYYAGQARVLHLISTGRLTKRFLRARAYWQGRTHGLMAGRTNGLVTPQVLRRESLAMTKEWLTLWHHLAAGDVRGAFECELSARKRLGYLHESLRRRGLRWLPASVG